MKAILILVCLCIVSTSFATEVKTDCIAMNEVTRDKVVKTIKPKTKSAKTASAQ